MKTRFPALYSIPELAFLVMVILGLCSIATFAQEETLSPATPQASVADVPAGAFAAVADDATLSVKVFREEVAKGLAEAAERDPKLSRSEKRRVARIMKGGWLYDSKREKIIDAASEQLYAAGVIAVTPEGVQAAIDWDKVLSILDKFMELLPIFIKLFGG